MAKESTYTCLTVLLATYNGADYIGEQLDSICVSADAYSSNYKIVISDDCSQDNTLELIQSNHFCEKIEVVSSGTKYGSAHLNFSSLLKSAYESEDSDYYMLSDQDDVWSKDKVTKSMQKIKELEKIHGENEPILLFTDAVVVDEGLNIIADSFWSNESLSPSLAKDFNKLCLHNVVQGATVLFNSALLRACGVIPTQARMHDHWLAMVASSFGVIDFLPDKTILYRQHSKNLVGSEHVSFWDTLRNLKFYFKKAQLSIVSSKVQATSFLNHYAVNISRADRDFLEDFINIGDKPIWLRKKFLLKHKITLGSFSKTVGLFIVI